VHISVIIPTRNRAQSVKALLDSLEVAACPERVVVEVLVVNNASTDETTELLTSESAKRRRFSLRILEETRLGKAHALNLGLANAGGEVVLIVDDDVTVDQMCLTGHAEAYGETEFVAIQGRVLPGKDTEGQTADPKRMREYNIPIVDYGIEFREIRGLTGTNMSFKREVFERVGFFDPRLGPGTAGFSEDTEFSMRIRKAGFKIGYTPHAIVYHELNPERYGREYYHDMKYRKGVSRSIYRNDPIVFRVVPDLVANCIRYCLYRLLGKTAKAYKTEGRIMKYWGYLMGKIQHRPKSKSTA